jgi:hypothetical protein
MSPNVVRDHRSSRKLSRSHCDLGIKSISIIAICACLAVIVQCTSVSAETYSNTKVLKMISNADQLLIRDCMRSMGFAYMIVRDPVEPPELEYPFGIDNIAWARANGFGRDLIERISANERYVSGLSQSEQNRYSLDLNGPGPSGPGVAVQLPTGEFLGHSTSGCIAEADRELYGNYDAWFKVDSQYQDLSNVADANVMSDPIYSSDLKQWSLCMFKSGFKFDSPAQAMEEFLSSSPPGPRAMAVQVAVREAVCGERVRLFRTSNQLAQKFNRSVDRRYAKLIRSAALFNEIALRHSRKVLGAT